MNLKDFLQPFNKKIKVYVKILNNDYILADRYFKQVKSKNYEITNVDVLFNELYITVYEV